MFMLDKEVEKMFLFCPLSVQDLHTYSLLKEKAESLAFSINRKCPDSDLTNEAIKYVIKALALAKSSLEQKVNQDHNKIKYAVCSFNIPNEIDTDIYVDGVVQEGYTMPFRIGNSFNITIDVEKGQILSWPKNVKTEVYYKIVDGCGYDLKNAAMDTLYSEDGMYVPSDLSIDAPGYGDYMIITIFEEGFIKNWSFNKDNWIGD
jgi:hypothetical protein